MAKWKQKKDKHKDCEEEDTIDLVTTCGRE